MVKQILTLTGMEMEMHVHLLNKFAFLHLCMLALQKILA